MKIRSIHLYLRTYGNPWVAVHRGNDIRFYNLTRASAWRLTRATYGLNGSHSVSGLGWSWTRS